MLISKLFLFLLIFLIIFYSIIGYGLITDVFFLSEKNKEKQKSLIEVNIISAFYLGITTLTILAFYYHLFFGFNKIINILILIFGLFSFFQRVKFIQTLKISIIPVLLFSGLLISKTHDDFVLYHYQYLYELNDNSLKFGLGNIDVRYAYSSLLAYLQAIFILPYYELRLFHVPIYLIYTSLISYLFFKFLNVKNRDKFLIFFILIFLILKIKRLSEFGYDYIVQFLIIYLFIEFYTEKKNNLKLFIIYLYCILIKLISIFFLPIIIFFYFRNKKEFFYKKNINYFLFAILIVLTIISDSLIKTGCLNYSIVASCFSNEIFSWSINKNLLDSYLQMVQLWSKGFFHQPGVRNDNIIEYLANFNWIVNWFYIHFYLKIFDSIILGTFIFIFLYFISNKALKTNYIEKQKDKNILLLLFISITFWLFNLPQFRFGFAIILLLLFFTLKFFFNNKTLVHKNFLIITIFSFIYFNYSNYIRINNEFKRSDEYKFSDFPFFSIYENNFFININSAGNEYFSPIKGKSGTCFNIPSICSIVNIDLKKIYILGREIIFIKSTKVL
jgi:hypothetical protein